MDRELASALMTHNLFIVNVFSAPLEFSQPVIDLFLTLMLAVCPHCTICYYDSVKRIDRVNFTVE